MSNPAPPYTLNNDTLTVVLNGKSYSVRRGTEKFEAARQAVLDQRWADLPALLSPGLAIERWLAGTEFSVEDGFISYQGERIDQSLNTRLMRMVNEGSSPKSWLNFWARLQKNPSYRSVTQLYAFLTHEDIPVDDEGYILAYKSVRWDYKDHHSGTFDNSPGKLCEMPRNKISDDPRVACHEGLHVGHIAYALGFGGSDSGAKRLIIVRVDPADVVCVPYDSSMHKVRVCKYEVVGNYSGQPLPSTTFREDPELEVKDDEDTEPEEETSRVVHKTKMGIGTSLCGNMGKHEGVSDFDNVVNCPKCIGLIKKGKGGAQATFTPPAKPTRGNPTVRPGTHVPKDGEAISWAMYDSMDEAGLMGLALPSLRPYASVHLKIVGASKIIGGKEALVKRILEVRRK